MEGDSRQKTSESYTTKPLSSQAVGELPVLTFECRDCAVQSAGSPEA